jgi:hypothetical protein
LNTSSTVLEERSFTLPATDTVGSVMTEKALPLEFKENSKYRYSGSRYRLV